MSEHIAAVDKKSFEVLKLEKEQIFKEYIQASTRLRKEVGRLRRALTFARKNVSPAVKMRLSQIVKGKRNRWN